MLSVTVGGACARGAKLLTAIIRTMYLALYYYFGSFLEVAKFLKGMYVVRYMKMVIWGERVGIEAW